MHNFIAISTGAKISPYLSPWRGVWPKYVFKSKYRMALFEMIFNLVDAVGHFWTSQNQPLRLTPYGDGLAEIGFSDPISGKFNLPEMVFRPHRAISQNKFPELNRKTHFRQMTPKNDPKNVPKNEPKHDPKKWRNSGRWITYMYRIITIYSGTVPTRPPMISGGSRGWNTMI